ncbi:MAG: radical SAM protein [Myxococcota bacterium]
MLSEETREQSVQKGKVKEHEEAAHDKRNWVRLTYECNDRCIFCLDSDTHDGEMRAVDEVRAQIIDGRRKGATRLILSGGEPTIHPRYVDFIKLGRLAGYRKIQTVTNGRMFAYRKFITRCIDAGLGEITFSIHGPNARIHDALVGVKGAFEQEVQGLRHALDDGRVIVNIDVCVNRGNVKVLPELIETFVDMGVKEYDLLQVIPFGRAFRDGRDTLFYDLEEAAPYLRKAFAWSKRPDMHIWLNRFPPEHCEGFEELIQDPYKLNDEVRGRKEEYERLLTRGVALDCREPDRCRYCYLERLCDRLDEVRAEVRDQTFDAVRIDAGFEATLGPAFGGDPASARRAKKEAAEREANGGTPPTPALGEGAGRRLRVLGQTELPVVAPEELSRNAGVAHAIVRAPDLVTARAALAKFPHITTVALELDDYSGIDALVSEGRARFDAVEVRSVYAEQPRAAEMLLALDADFEVIVALTRENADYLTGQTSPRLVLRQPNYERLTDAQERDLPDLRAFVTERSEPVENVPPCIAGRAPRPAPVVLDTTMMTAQGQLEIFRYARRFIDDHYYVKSLRCKECRYVSDCRGAHINFIRAHGLGQLAPVS